MKEGRHSVYIRKGKVIAPFIAETPSGYLDVDPVRVLDCGDVAGLSEIVHESVRDGNPKGPGYVRGKSPPPVVLKATKTRTWSQFAEGTGSIGWEVASESCTINEIRNMGLRGVAGYEPVVVEEFSREVDIAIFVEAIVRHVQTMCAAQEL